MRNFFRCFRVLYFLFTRRSYILQKSIIRIIALLLFASVSVAFAQQPKSEKLIKIEQALKDDAPKILCLNEDFATAAQPREEAFAKLAANGFRSVLNLRTDAEGVDLKREQELVEKSAVKYFNVPVVGSAPKTESVEAFIKIIKDKANHPMLIHCASANRVGAFWMIYRVVEQGWSEDKALEEATQIGLSSPGLKKFAQDYIATHK
jgi:uncharacterized protein (TIGR01244 family)